MELLSSTIAAGSIKTVDPVEDISCTIPETVERYSALTGTQYLSPLIVITGSIRYDLSCPLIKF